MFAEYILTGESQSELNTEMRFLLAGANVDKKSLVRFETLTSADGVENSRIRSCILRVLRNLRKEGIIQFFVTSDGFKDETTEAVFLMNKYSEYIDENERYIYVKL